MAPQEKKRQHDKRALIAATTSNKKGACFPCSSGSRVNQYSYNLWRRAPTVYLAGWLEAGRLAPGASIDLTARKHNRPSQASHRLAVPSHEVPKRLINAQAARTSAFLRKVINSQTNATLRI